MIHGMDVETAQRYIETVDKINEIVDKIYAISYVMGAFSSIEQGEINLNPNAVGYLGKEISNDVIRISELLDDHFISRVEVLLELEALKNNDE